jgi:hypothetical protein
MHPLVQIDLPPYTDYASLEQKLTIAVECVSVPTRSFTRIDTIASAGRLLDLVRSREYLVYFDNPFTPSDSLPFIMTRTLVFPLMSPPPTSSACLVSRQCAVTHVHDASISFHDFRLGSTRLGYYSISCGLLLMCNKSLSYESLLVFPIVCLKVLVLSFLTVESHIKHQWGQG